MSFRGVTTICRCGTAARTLNCAIRIVKIRDILIGDGDLPPPLHGSQFSGSKLAPQLEIQIVHRQASRRQPPLGISIRL